jgi:hypothetical protein
MTLSISALIKEQYGATHVQAILLADKLTDEQLHWHPTTMGNPLAFHLWHMTRWADHLQAAIPGMTDTLGQRLGPGVEIWEEEHLGARWGFDALELGYAQTGMTMRDDKVINIPFPGKEELMTYARKAFAAAERAVQLIDETQFHALEQPQPRTEGIWQSGSTVGSVILAHLIHDNRHLGMMECLFGLQSGSGTATI